MNQSDNEWKKRYFDSLADFERKEKQWGEAESVLRRSISRMTFVGDGMDAELDGKLDQLRNQVRTEKDLSRLQRMIESITKRAETLQAARPSDGDSRGTDASQAGEILLQLLQEARFPKDLKARVKRLQKEIKGSPQALSALKELKALVVEGLESAETAAAGGGERGGGLLKGLFSKETRQESQQSRPAGQVAEPEPRREGAAGEFPDASLILLLIDLLSEGSEGGEELKAVADRFRAADTSRALESLVGELAGILEKPLAQPAGASADKILLELVERFDLTSEMQPKAAALKKRLARGVPEGEIPAVLDDILLMMGHIRQQAERDRQEVEQFLLQLTERLQELDRELEGVDRTSAELLVDGRSHDEMIRGQVSDMHATVERATDLGELKVAISERLTLLQERLREHRAEEEHKIENLESSIDSLQGKIGVMEEESLDLKKRVEAARAEAFRDALTGLNNRHAFDVRLEQEYARWQRYGFPMSLIVLDVDHFKKVNDTYGHIAGDKVLQVIGRQLNSVIREVDFAARYGGEEFVVLLPETDIQSAHGVAEKIRSAVQEKPFHSGDKRVTITVSCGVASFHEDDSMQLPFERADRALYKAKGDGRNRSCLESETGS
jgi:diguanylate cyclase